MKNTLAILCLAGSTIALSACNGTGHIDTDPPYALERTATHTQEMQQEMYVAPTAVAPAERVFQRAQTK